MPGPARSHAQYPGCHFTPEASDFDPRIAIYISTTCKITLYYIFNKKGIQISAEFNQFNPINAKLKETDVSTAYTHRKCIVFLLHYSEVQRISLKYTDLHNLN